MQQSLVSLRRGRRGRYRPGAAAIEFAACGTAFVILIMGIFELGRGFMAQHQLTNAARLGCRIGVLDNKATSDVTTAVQNNLTAQGINPTNATITVAVNGNSSVDVSLAQSQDNITVTVSLSAQSISWVPLTRYLTGNLAGSYTLRRE